jgi:hypothetical protein
MLTTIQGKRIALGQHRMSALNEFSRKFVEAFAGYS